MALILRQLRGLKMKGFLVSTQALVFKAVKPANPKALAPLTKLKISKSPRSFFIIHQGLIGWGTLTFRLVNLHTKHQKSTF